jgi:hypothetical protein
MTDRTRGLVVALSVLLASLGCASPKHTGGGEIEAVLIRPDLKPVGLYVAPGEEYIVVQMAAPAHLNVVYSPVFLQEKLRSLAYQDLAFGDTAETAACLAPLKAHVLDMPEFIEATSADLPKVFNSDRINRIPGQGSWVVTSSDRERSNVWILGGDPPRFVKSGRTALPRNLRGRAVDDRTSLLLLTDDTNRLEFFDLSNMQSVGIITLPCREVTNALVARNGLAWVGTRDGGIVPVDVEKRAAEEMIRLGTGKGNVFLALSDEGRMLAVAVQDLSAGKPPYPTYLKVFLLNGDARIELARTFFEHRSLIKDLAVMEKTETVVVATRSHLLRWQWNKKPKE